MIHPGAWLAWASGAALVAFSTTNPFYLVVLISIAWSVHGAHRRPGPNARSFRVFLVFAVWAMAIRTVLVVLGTVDGSSVTVAALEGLRLGVILILFGTFNSVTDPFGILRLAPRRFYEAALAAALALSLAPRTIAAVQRVRDAQRVRGMHMGRWRALPALAVPVLATGMEEAVTLAESMDARGHGRGRRTRYRPGRWGAGSWAVALGAAVAAGAFTWAALAGAGDLQPSLFPLRWPDAHAGLVAAACVLALPVGLRPAEARP